MLRFASGVQEREFLRVKRGMLSPKTVHTVLPKCVFSGFAHFARQPYEDDFSATLVAHGRRTAVPFMRSTLGAVFAETEPNAIPDCASVGPNQGGGSSKMANFAEDGHVI